jgi:hypothetical protein
VPETEKTLHAHHILPVLYHHFGCVPPTHAGLSLISQLSRLAVKPLDLPAQDPNAGKGKKEKKSEAPPPKPILEIGSGTGYWTYMIRTLFPDLDVTAIDSGLSNYRTSWIGDTVASDGPAYLRSHNGGRGTILLLVYPSVGDDFTEKVLKAFYGDAVVVAGTVNHNGFTGFQNQTMAEWIEEHGHSLPVRWTEVARIPLPSFAGKDEGLFVFRAGDDIASSSKVFHGA